MQTPTFELIPFCFLPSPRVFELVFPHVDEKAKLKMILPCSLVKESVVIMIHALCNSGYASEVSQATVELVIGQCVDALLDDKFAGISCSKSQAQIGSILRAINKVNIKARRKCVTHHIIVFSLEFLFAMISLLARLQLNQNVTLH